VYASARERFAICESLLAITGGLLAIRRCRVAVPIAHQRRQIAGCGGRVSFMGALKACRGGVLSPWSKWPGKDSRAGCTGAFSHATINIGRRPHS